MTIKIAICNVQRPKGIVSSAVNLAVCFAKLGQKVLLIDGVPHRNSTRAVLGKSLNPAMLDTIGGCMIREKRLTFYPTRYYNLLIAPASHSDTKVGQTLSMKIRPGDLLARAMDFKDRPDVQAIDIILIDCDHNICEDFYARNGILYSDYVIIPVDVQEGGHKSTVKTLREFYEDETPVLGAILLNGRPTSIEGIESIVGDCKKMGIKVFEPYIPMSLDIFDADGGNISVIDHKPKCEASASYMKLASNIIEHIDDLESKRLP